MRTINAILAVAALAMLTQGCATPDQQVTQLRSENDNLKQQVNTQTGQIRDLTRQKDKLEMDFNYCTKRNDVLEKEKGARIEEAAQTRKGVREFTDQVMNSLQTYFQKAEVVDYVGGELLARASVDSLKNLVLVDLANTIRADGTVIGARAYLSGPTRLQFCLVRPDEQGGKYAIVSITPPIVAADSGSQSWNFEVPMAAKKGDLIGVYLPDDVNIPYDDADTGHVVAVPGPAKLNSALALSTGAAKNKRAYSFGVVGYFDTAGAASATESPGK